MNLNTEQQEQLRIFVKLAREFANSLDRWPGGAIICRTESLARSILKCGRNGDFCPPISQEAGVEAILGPNGAPVEVMFPEARRLDDEEGLLVECISEIGCAAEAYLNGRRGSSLDSTPDRLKEAANDLNGLLNEDAAAIDDNDYKPARWFSVNTKILASRLRHAAAGREKRKTKHVRKKLIDGVTCYSVPDCMRWWPFDMTDG